MKMAKKLGHMVSVNVQVTHSKGKPAVELRRLFTDPETVKAIVSSAMHDNSIIILPIFSDKIDALSSLIKKGILYRDEHGQYKFTL